MSKPERLAVNIDFLRSPEKFSPDGFAGHILGQDGQKFGFWHARVCNKLAEFVQHFPYAEASISAIQSKRAEIWPLAFLNQIEVDEDHRNKGLGKIGLMDFLAEAEKRKCHIAMVRIGWSESSAMEKNLHFYKSNGWKELFQNDSNGVPIELPLSYYAL